MNEANQTATQLPDTLLMGGISYSVSANPELQAFRDATVKVSSINAAQQEKAKLYSQMEALKQSVLDLKQVKVDAPAIDTEKLKNEIVAAVDEKFNERISAAIEPLRKNSEDAQKDALEKYKQQLLTENAGKIIPDLIEGNTREQLDAALSKSIKLFSQYATQGTENQNDQAATNNGQSSNQTNSQNTQPANNNQAPANTQNANTGGNTSNNTGNGTPPVVNAPANTGVNTNVELPNIKKMSTEEWAKNRDGIKAKVDALMGVA